MLKAHTEASGNTTSHDLNKLSPTHVEVWKELPENIIIFPHTKNTNMTCEKIFFGMLHYNCCWKSFLSVLLPFTVYIYDSLRSESQQRKNIQFNFLRPLFNEWNEWRRNWKGREKELKGFSNEKLIFLFIQNWNENWKEILFKGVSRVFIYIRISEVMNFSFVTLLKCWLNSVRNQTRGTRLWSDD